MNDLDEKANEMLTNLSKVGFDKYGDEKAEKTLQKLDYIKNTLKSQENQITQPTMTSREAKRLASLRTSIKNAKAKFK